MPLQFRPDSEAGSVLHSWWVRLEDNKGDRAALRRCQEPLEALFVPAYHQLYHALRPYDGSSDLRLPAIAALLAHVKHILPGPDFATQMAAPKLTGGEAPRLSELRFRRVLQCQTINELFPALRRVIALLDDSVNIYSLADNLYWWGDRVRRDWAYAYYGALR
jgi:CRISPR system Cascade subunit CasB